MTVAPQRSQARGLPFAAEPATTGLPVTADAPLAGAAVRRALHQAPNAVLMVRPHFFTPNPETMVDNEFMTVPDSSPDEVARAAYLEVTVMADQLRAAGVDVHLMEDVGRATPDSVFPNNWFTTHADGSLVTYPMRSTARRWERRVDIIADLHQQFEITRNSDYTAWEEVGRYLEGTGVMVLDHLSRIAYVCRSPRADEKVLRLFCRDHGYRAVVFDATDAGGVPIYHTNVMMAVGTQIAIVALETIRDPEERARLVHELDESGREVVSISEEQMGEFAGNALEVWTGTHPLLVMSARGWRSLDTAQQRRLESAHEVLPVDVATIEHAGGSARCMLAGLHAPARSD